jgi:hypothetical protein
MTTVNPWKTGSGDSGVKVHPGAGMPLPQACL